MSTTVGQIFTDFLMFPHLALRFEAMLSYEAFLEAKEKSRLFLSWLFAHLIEWWYLVLLS